MITTLDVARFRMLLIEELIFEYNLDERKAELTLKSSVVNKMLNKSPDFIMHYSIEDNTREIYDEYCGIPYKV